MSQATVRNFLFEEVFSAIDIRDRKRLFEHLVDSMNNFENVFYYCSHLEYRNPQRFRMVQEETRRILSNEVLKKELTKKTTFCTKKNCEKDRCNFAHSIEEYNPPTCLYKEFCNDFKCVKNHGFTKEEYITLYKIEIPKPVEVNLSFTQMCQIMKKNNPCIVKGCKFAHSIEQLKPLVCFKDCKKEDCKLKHTDETMEVYIEKQGIKVKEWMYERTSEMNSFEGIEIYMRLRRKEECDFIDELRKEEENGYEYKEEKDEEEKEDEEEDIEVILFRGKSSINFSEILMFSEVHKQIKEKSLERELSHLSLF